MQSLDVYKYINTLTRARGDDLSRGAPRTNNLNRTFKGDEIDIHVFADHSDCLQILKDTNFIQPKIADALSAIFKSLGLEITGIENFLRKNPISMDGPHHNAARQSFIKEFRDAQRKLSDSLPVLSRRAFESFIDGKKSRITADLIEPFVDAVIEAILDDKSYFAKITRDSWIGNSSCIFEYVHSVTKLKKRNGQAVRLARQLGSKLDSHDEGEIKAGPILLSYVLQGRDPLVGALSAYMHSLVSINEDERRFSIDTINARELFWRTSPVNYIGRIATKPVTIRGIHIQVGDHIVLMLPWANHDSSALAKNSLAFGTGPHVCAGQALALTIADAWINELKSQLMRIRWQEIRPDRLIPAVFRQYGIP
jgi:cytochrome P450